MKRPISVALMLAFCLSVLAMSCVSPEVSVAEYPHSDGTTYRISGLFTDVSRDHVGWCGNLVINVYVFISKVTNDTTYTLKFVALAPRELRVVPGDILKFEVGISSRIVACSGPVDFGDDKSHMMMDYMYHLSGGFYPLDRSSFNLLTSGRPIRFEIHTSEGVVPCLLKSSRSKALKKFREEYAPQLTPDTI